MDLNETTDETELSEVPIPRHIRLLILLLLDIPSFICTIFLLFNIFKNRVLRRSLHNHVIITLLFSVLPCQVIDIPFHVIYLSLGYVWPSNENFCLFWLFVSIGIFDITGILMGYASIERHMLVFHERWLMTKKRQILLHYIPLFLVISYSILFYLYAILFPPCTTNFNYTKTWCSYPCYYDVTILTMYDTIAHVLIPTFVVLFFSLGLFIRVILRKRRVVARTQWRKHRKMIIQLLSVSSLLLVFNLPVAILIVARLSGLPADTGVVFGQYAYFFTYCIPLLLPFVTLLSFPEISKKLIRKCRNQYRRFRPQHTATIHPMT